MGRIYYQCSECGQRFAKSPIAGVPQGMYLSGCRVSGNAFYCEECVKTWKERNGEEFDKQIASPKKQFADWWNREVKRQVKDNRSVKACRQLANGDFVEC